MTTANQSDFWGKKYIQQTKLITHVEHLTKKLFNAIYEIRQLKPMTARKGAKTRYFAYFRSLLL